MSFDQAFALTVSPAVEGGFQDRHDDAGNWTCGRVGAGTLMGTNQGISAAFLWSLPASDPFHARDPRGLGEADIRAIYEAHFWRAVHGDDLAAPVAALLFDAAVNQGQGWAPTCLQSALGVRPDGYLGPKTLRAAAGADPLVLHAEIGRIRAERYRSDAGWAEYGVGWMRRLFRVVAATASFA